MSEHYLENLDSIVNQDIHKLKEAQENYGDSWKKRGGVGAYMVMIRKFDRLDNYMPKFGYDVFTALEQDNRDEGVIDDIRDARRYLLLIEAEYLARKASKDEKINDSSRSLQTKGTKGS